VIWLLVMSPKLSFVCASVVFAGLLFGAAQEMIRIKQRQPESFAGRPPTAQSFSAASAGQSSSTNSFPSDAARKVLEDFLQWAENYTQVGPDEKARASADGLSLATERRRILAELIESDPAEALRQGIPMRVREKLPPEVVKQLEERVSGRGDFTVIATLPSPGAEKTVRPIERFVTLAGKTYQAFVYGRRLTQPTRTNIPLYGVAIDDKLAVHEDPTRPLESGEIPDPGLPAGNPYEQKMQSEDARLAAPSAWTSGIKNVLFMRVNFPDDPAESISMADAISMMNYVSNWYHTVSYQITALNTTVTPLLTLPHTKASYQSSGDYFGLLTDARAVAKTNGFDTANFDLDCVHLLPTFPGWGGRAFIGAKGAWLQTFYHVAVASHEFGHNYGLSHANLWNAFDDTIIGPGVHVEYGNFFDAMGTSEDNSASEIDAYQFNAYEKNLLGWLPDANVATVTTSGVYRVHAFDVPSLNSNSFHALRIRKDDTRYYWGELRSLFPDYRWVKSGLMLNWSPWAQSGGGTHILDATPGTPFGQNDCPVVVGQTFSDPFAGFHLTVLRENTNTTPGSLDVLVQFGSFPGNRPPTVTMSATATAVAQNVSVDFTATASDPNGDELSYYWDFSNDDIDATVGPNAPNATQRWRFRGHYLVRCIVSDMKGGIATAQVLMSIGSPPLYTISGQVLNQGAPVEGVRVKGANGWVGYSDTNGNYIVGNVPTGTHTLTAFKPGWTLSPANFSNPVSVGSSSLSNVNFSGTLVPYQLSGSVFDQGSVLPDVTVTLGGTNSTVTDANGFYLFSNLRAGNYDVTATKPDYDLQPMNFSNPIAVDWQNIASKNFEAQLAFLLTEMRQTNGGVAFRLQGGSNRVIRIEASTNLVNWVTIATVTNTTGKTDFVDAPFSTPLRFYRGALLP
jgi:hypothetical protein